METFAVAVAMAMVAFFLWFFIMPTIGRVVGPPLGPFLTLALWAGYFLTAGWVIFRVNGRSQP